MAILARKRGASISRKEENGCSVCIKFLLLPLRNSRAVTWITYQGRPSEEVVGGEWANGLRGIFCASCPSNSAAGIGAASFAHWLDMYHKYFFIFFCVRGGSEIAVGVAICRAETRARATSELIFPTETGPEEAQRGYVTL